MVVDDFVVLQDLLHLLLGVASSVAQEQLDIGVVDGVAGVEVGIQHRLHRIIRLVLLLVFDILQNGVDGMTIIRSLRTIRKESVCSRLRTPV